MLLHHPGRLATLVLAMAGLQAACTTGGPVTSPKETPETKVAVEFAQSLVSGNYAHAHELLGAGLRSTLSPAQLKTDFTNMVGEAGGVPTVATTMTMDSWPDKKADDLKWVYVAIAADAYSEAVTVVVAREAGKLVIRSVEWGRP